MNLGTTSPIFDTLPFHLNRLLYEAMRTGNADLTPSGEVVVGFSNCGRGFCGAFKHSWQQGKLLSANVEYPPYLVIEAADGGTRWARPPETKTEQLYHFIYYLREVLRYLAANPIGKKTNVSPSDIARTLIQLPKRHALVRSGNHVGSIITDDTLPRMHYSIGSIKAVRAKLRKLYDHKYVQFDS